MYCEESTSERYSLSKVCLFSDRLQHKINAWFDHFKVFHPRGFPAILNVRLSDSSARGGFCELHNTARQPLRDASDRNKEHFGRRRRTEAQQCHLVANLDTPSTVSSRTVFISLLRVILFCVFVLAYVETQHLAKGYEKSHISSYNTKQ